MEKQCPNCELNFIPNSGKQKFCSDKCKVAYARKTAKGIKGVKVASEIPTPENKKVVEIELQDIELAPKEKWVTEIEQFCELEGILPKDLIKAYKTKGKAKKEADLPLNEQIENVSGVSNFSVDLRRKKCGF